MSVAITLLSMLILLFLKGFFSGSEIAFVSADRAKLRSRAARGNAGARLAQKLLSDPSRLLTTTLLGTNITTIALATLGTLLMVQLFQGSGEIIAVLVFTPLFLILGEIVPKSVYQQKANEIVPIAAYPLAFLQVALAPLVWVFSAIARLAARLLGGTTPSNAVRDDFLAAVRVAEKSGVSAAFSRGQVRNVLRFAQMYAAEVMWPLEEIRIFERSTPISQLVAYRMQTGHRLVMLYDDDPKRVSAIAALESWDLLDPTIESRSIDELLTPMEVVTEDKPVSEIVELLHKQPNLGVIVADASGNSIGIITLNMLVRGTLGTQASALTDRRTERAPTSETAS